MPHPLPRRWPWQFRAIDRLAEQAEAQRGAAGSRSLHEVTPEATRLERQHAAGAAGTRDADPHLVSSASIGKLFIC